MSPLDPLLVVIGMAGVAFMLYAFTTIKLVKGTARTIATSILMLILVLVGNRLLGSSDPGEAEQPWFADPFADLWPPNILQPNLETAQTGFDDILFEAIDLMLSQGLDAAPPVAPSPPLTPSPAPRQASPLPSPLPSIQPTIQPTIQPPVQPPTQAQPPTHAPASPTPVNPVPVSPVPVSPVPASPLQPAPIQPIQPPVQPSPLVPSPIPNPAPKPPAPSQPTPFPDSDPYNNPDHSEPVPAWW